MADLTMPEPPDEHPTQQLADDYTLPPSYPAPKKSRTRWLLFPLVIILLGAAAFGVGKLTTKKPAQQPIQTPTQATSQTKSDIADSSETKEYSNGFLAIKLNYPATWTATESANQDSVMLVSPTFDYAKADGNKVNGTFKIYIRKQARDVDSKYIGRGYAVAPSEKLKYVNPAPGQLAETNLSLFGLDEPTNFAFFLIAGNFSLNKGDSLGPSYGKEADTYIIAGGFTSKDLTDDLATNEVDPELLTTSNAYKQAKTILGSLQLR